MNKKTQNYYFFFVAIVRAFEQTEKFDLKWSLYSAREEIDAWYSHHSLCHPLFNMNDDRRRRRRLSIEFFFSELSHELGVRIKINSKNNV